MSFEHIIAELNEHFFFREFVFSKNTFRPNPHLELELADSILWLDELLVVFQLKSRQAPEATSGEKEKRWFDRKVIGVGTRQIRDTLSYLGENEQIELENHRGDKFQLDRQEITTLKKVICYLPHSALTPDCRCKKFHYSSTAGVIHLISASDYYGIVRTLLTPAEFSDYLAFREKVIEKWTDAIDPLPEPALVGQYLAGDANDLPSLKFIEHLRALEHQANEWDMSGVISRFPDRITTNNASTDYYSIVAELAKLKRNELREFKRRFELSMEKSREGQFVKPYRMASPRTGCGFLFIPLDPELIPHRKRGLQNLTYACKYDLRLKRCIGVSFAPEKDGWFSVEWCYIEFPWEYEPELAQQIERDNPFREVGAQKLSRYAFRETD